MAYYYGMGEVEIATPAGQATVQRIDWSTFLVQADRAERPILPGPEVVDEQPLVTGVKFDYQAKTVFANIGPDGGGSGPIVPSGGSSVTGGGSTGTGAVITPAQFTLMCKDAGGTGLPGNGCKMPNGAVAYLKDGQIVSGHPNGSTPAASGGAGGLAVAAGVALLALMFLR
jgi:hypothetical protein